MKSVDNQMRSTNPMAMPGKPYRSKLNPHLELIRQLRRARKTWAEIAEILTGQHACPTSPQAVYAFFKRRVSGRQPLGFEDEPLQTSATELSASNPVPQQGKKLTDSELKSLIDEAPAPLPQKIAFKDPFQKP